MPWRLGSAGEALESAGPGNLKAGTTWALPPADSLPADPHLLQEDPGVSAVGELGLDPLGVSFFDPGLEDDLFLTDPPLGCLLFLGALASAPYVVLVKD